MHTIALKYCIFILEPVNGYKRRTSQVHIIGTAKIYKYYILGIYKHLIWILLLIAYLHKYIVRILSVPRNSQYKRQLSRQQLLQTGDVCVAPARCIGTELLNGIRVCSFARLLVWRGRFANAAKLKTSLR